MSSKIISVWPISTKYIIYELIINRIIFEFWYYYFVILIKYTYSILLYSTLYYNPLPAITKLHAVVTVPFPPCPWHNSSCDSTQYTFLSGHDYNRVVTIHSILFYQAMTQLQLWQYTVYFPTSPWHNSSFDSTQYTLLLGHGNNQVLTVYFPPRPGHYSSCGRTLSYQVMATIEFSQHTFHPGHVTTRVVTVYFPPVTQLELWQYTLLPGHGTSQGRVLSNIINF